MSKSITDLQQLLAPSKAVVQGTITGIQGNVLTVSSTSGPKTFFVANPGAYAIGDKVRSQGGMLLGKVSSEEGLPHYSV